MVRTGLTLLIQCLALMIWAVSAQAQSALPALFDVTGVASNDVLNVRAAPSASASIIGTLSPDALDVEVIRRSTNGRWGLVNLGEASGWASLKFLDRVGGQNDDELPRRLTCFGTEPFWSVDVSDTNVALRTPSDQVSFDLLTSQTASGRLDRFSFIATEILREVHGVVRRAACNDGMSDREFGLDVDLILLRGSSASHLTGCCSLAVN